MLTLPSGVHLTFARKTQDGFARAFGRAGGTRLGSATIERKHGRCGLARLRDERDRVLLADAVRDHRRVERLLFSEHRLASLALAPRAHDRHGSSPWLGRHSGTTLAPQPIRLNRAFPLTAEGRSFPALGCQALAPGPRRRYSWDRQIRENAWEDSTARSWW